MAKEIQDESLAIAGQDRPQFRSENPWFSIWTRPRQTIRQIVDSDPTERFYLLVFCGGIITALGRASEQNMGDTTPLDIILFGAVIFGGGLNILWVYLLGWLLKHTGEWLGGNASPVELRAAIAWSYVIPIWTSIIWVLELALFGQEMFTKATPMIDSNRQLQLAYYGMSFVHVSLGVWGIGVFLKCIAEVQRFSVWRALVSVLFLLATVVGVVLSLRFILR